MHAARLRLRAAAVAVAAALTVAACAGGDGAAAGSGDGVDYPTGDITLVIPYEPGGSFDPIGRFYASKLEEKLGTTVVVENRAGGAATIGTQYVLDAEPDGYTLGVGSGNAVAFQPYVNDDLGYKSVEDLMPIVKLGESIQVIATRPDAPWGNFDDFLAHAKANPGQVKVGVSGRMAQTDLSLHQLMSELGVEMVSVPNSGGGGDSMLELLGGRIDAIITSSSGAQGQVEAGEIRLLTVGGTKETELFPGVPPIGNYIAEPLELIYFIFGPLDVPADVSQVIEEASLEVVRSPEFEQFCAENGFTYDPVGSADLMQQLKTAEQTYGELVPLFEG